MPLLGRLTIVVPAAGLSSRAGADNKLLLPFGSASVISTVASKAVPLANRTLVVVGHDADRVGAAVSHMAVEIVRNDRFAEGMATSIVTAVSYDSDASYYLIWPADMPTILPQTVQTVIQRARDGHIAVPVFEGRRGHPVLFSAAFRDELLLLRGDTGARSILDRNPSAVDEIVVPDPGILIDIDGSEALEKLRRSSAGGTAST